MWKPQCWCSSQFSLSSPKGPYSIERVPFLLASADSGSVLMYFQDASVPWLGRLLDFHLFPV